MGVYALLSQRVYRLLLEEYQTQSLHGGGGGGGGGGGKDPIFLLSQQLSTHAYTLHGVFTFLGLCLLLRVGGVWARDYPGGGWGHCALLVFKFCYV